MQCNHPKMKPHWLLVGGGAKPRSRRHHEVFWGQWSAIVFLSTCWSWHNVFSWDHQFRQGGVWSLWFFRNEIPIRQIRKIPGYFWIWHSINCKTRCSKQSHKYFAKRQRIGQACNDYGQETVSGLYDVTRFLHEQNAEALDSSRIDGGLFIWKSQTIMRSRKKVGKQFWWMMKRKSRNLLKLPVLNRNLSKLYIFRTGCT